MSTTTLSAQTEIPAIFSIGTVLIAAYARMPSTAVLNNESIKIYLIIADDLELGDSQLAAVPCSASTTIEALGVYVQS